MPYLFDGYNVYHAATKLGGDWLHLTPSALCELIARDMARLGDHATVVFDGRRPRGRPEMVQPAGFVTLLYSEAITADERLDELIRANSAPRRLVVVSSDREVRAAGRRRRARVLPAVEYLQEMLERMNRPPRPPRDPKEKRQGVPKGELGAWLDYFGLDDDDDRDEFHRMR